MSEAKIEIKIGEIQFSGQGDQDWVAKQLDKILTQAEKLIQLAPPPKPPEEPGFNSITDTTMTLPAFLNEKGATKNQVKKFLAAATWIQAKGKSRIKTSDVTTALKDSNQTRLSNPADCLKKNISKGYCEKDGNQFFVTDDGKKSL